MTIKQEVAYGIIEAITDLREGDDLKDFTVIVDDVSERCHKFILGACSLYFRGLFRSGMKETVENRVTLKAVSHQTFTVILTALYTGCDIITEENVIDVWRAAHMLQIGFLVKECEKYIEQNISIDNFEKFYETAKLLDSETVLKTEHEFMTKNFDLIRTSQTLLKLSYSEIKALVETDELITTTEDNVVESILQWVSYSPPETSEQGTEVKLNIMRLAVQIEDEDQEDQPNTSQLNEEEPVNITNGNSSNETNEVGLGDEHVDSHNTSQEGKQRTDDLSEDNENLSRVKDKMTSTNEAAILTLAPVHKQTQTSLLPEGRQHLMSLMSIARCCLLSPEYLEELLSNPIITDNSEVRSIVFKAVNYQLQTGHRHGQWPSAAIHRNNSPFQNVVILTKFKDYHDSFRCNPIYVQPFCWPEEFIKQLTTNVSSGKLTAFDNELYELNGAGLHVFSFRDESWKLITDCRLSAETLMIPLGNYIYFLDGSTKELKAVNPTEKLSAMQDQPAFPGESSLTGATKFHDRILVFSSLVNEENELETAVHCFSPSKKSWEKLENLKGPAKGIISFHNDNDTFLLQTNGNLWIITADKIKNGLVEIAFYKKAWDFHWDLYGAAIFRERLFIYGGKLPEGKKISFSLLTHNLHAHSWTQPFNMCATPIIIPSKYLTKL